MTFAEKQNKVKEKRSNALNSKVKILQERINAVDENDYNKTFLFGDGTYSGILDLIKLYYEEKNLERGLTYTTPTLANINNETTWNDQFEDAITTTGDGEFYLDSNGDGLADEDINLTTDWLNDNGEGTETTGLLKDLNDFLYYNIGINATNVGPVNSGYDYSDTASTVDAAETVIYGSDDPATANVDDYDFDWAGRGLKGRRTRDVEIFTESDGGTPANYRYVIGEGTSDEPTFYADTADSNGATDGNKTDFLTNLSSLISLLDSSSDYVTKLTELYNEVNEIVNNNNEIFEESGMTSDVDDDTIDINNTINSLSTYIGSNTDVVTDDTLWGYYNWFNSADGTEANFDTYLTDLETLITNIESLIDTRYGNVESHIGGVYSTSATDFTKLRKWRYFWIKAVIGKPTSSLVTLNGLDTAINIANNNLINANEELATLLGATAEAQEQYIPIPEMITAFENNLFNDDGSLNSRRVGIAYIGQQHATRYKVYRKPLEEVNVDNTEWEELEYDFTEEFDEKTQNVSMTYNDTDTGFSVGQKYAYRIRTFDYTNDSFVAASNESKLYVDTDEYSFASISNSVIEIGEHDFQIGQYVAIKNTVSSDGYYFVASVNESKIGIFPSIVSEDAGNLYLAPSIVFILTEQPIGPPLEPSGELPSPDYTYVPHNNLGGLQGGSANQYYHLSFSNYQKVLTLDPAAAEGGIFAYENTSDPTLQDDGENTSGNGVFEPGDIWVNTVSEEVFVNTDNTTNAANWASITSGSSGGLPSTSSTVLTSSTTNIDVVANTYGAIKWNVYVNGNSNFSAVEILAVNKDNIEMDFTEYARVGDSINYDLSVDYSGSDIVLQLTNNEAYSLDVKIVRIAL